MNLILILLACMPFPGPVRPAKVPYESPATIFARIERNGYVPPFATPTPLPMNKHRKK